MAVATFQPDFKKQTIMPSSRGMMPSIPLKFAASEEVSVWQLEPTVPFMAVAVAGVSVPSFILASLFQYVMAYRLKWLPTAGWGESPFQLLMPALALAAFPAAFISRLIRSSLLNVLSEDYIRTARSKGLSKYGVARHALRNALLPVVTYCGPLLAGLLTGSFVVEDIFAIPGLGQFFVSSIRDRDYTVLMGVTVFYAALLIGLNVCVDVLYVCLDPRIRSGRETA